MPQDPGAPGDLAKHGLARFDFGGFWFKGQHMSTGRCPVKRYNRHLRNLIAQEKVRPSWIVSHDLLNQAPEAYKHFDAREEGWTKVVLHPGQGRLTVPQAPSHTGHADVPHDAVRVGDGQHGDPSG